MLYQLHHGNNLEILRTLADNSIDAIVTDPPYGLGKEPDALAMLRDWMTGDHHEVKGKGFMGKEWDAFVPQPALWKECLRVLKPGGHLLAFAGTRTQDLMALGLRIAGFEIRDMAAWLYGSGFPKSLDVSKAIDKAAGAEREVIGLRTTGIGTGNGSTPIMGDGNRDITAPATDAARQWQGWGTALKPALEPITVARKPLAGTVAENVQAHGTGALNIDGCRVGEEATVTVRNGNSGAHGRYGKDNRVFTRENPPGRWPANVLHDGSEEVVRLFPGEGDTSAARFFKCCPSDSVCPLCNLTHAKACNNIQAWKSILVSSAGKRGWTSQATSEFIARVNAIVPASERIVQNVKSAGNLCDSCAISIAVALVAIKTSDFSNEELQAILAYTGNCNNSTLTQNLACFADLWVNIDTIPTTKSLSLLFGSVQDVTGNFTRQDTRAGEEPKCEPSRFAYVPKASKADREGSTHPTMKPTELMRYLCRLVTPPGGVVLDPFMGSGSTGKAAMLEGFRFIGIEREAEYVEIAKARVGDAAIAEIL